MTGVKALGLPEARRNEAAAEFRARGLPTRRVEDWKYTDLSRALGEGGFGEATAQWAISKLPAGVEMFDLADGAAPDWVRAHLGGQKENVLGTASLVFARGGVALRVTGAAAGILPLEFSGAGHLRALVVLEEGASLTLMEHHTAHGASRNVGMEIVLGAGARLDHVRVAPVALPAVQMEEINARLAASAQYHAHFAAFGARLSRVQLSLSLGGEGAQAHLSGVSLLGDGAHADITTHVTHAVGDTISTQLFKKVAGGKSRAVYQGKVTVAQHADGADSRQTAKALLLGHQAEADLKPELEIFADDVKCAHGAAVGDLDADSLFYLRARGLPERDARALLLHAFLEDAMTGIADENLRAAVRQAVDHALAAVAA